MMPPRTPTGTAYSASVHTTRATQELIIGPFSLSPRGSMGNASADTVPRSPARRFDIAAAARRLGSLSGKHATYDSINVTY